MSRKLHFYAAEDDKGMIADILRDVFEQLIDVTYYKTQYSAFDERTEKKCYLAEESRVNDIVFRVYEGSDGSVSHLLDDEKSPVLEYSPSIKSPDGIFWEGRFYCRSVDSDFLKKVSAFFARFKRAFLYAKKFKVYISPNIDLSATKFGSYEESITEEDLS